MKSGNTNFVSVSVRKILPVGLIVSLLLVFVTASCAAEPFRAGRGFALRKEIKKARLTTDGSYTVRLYTQREGRSPYDRALLLSIRDERSGKTFSFRPAGVAGYEANIEIANFTGRDKSEIFLSMQSGGSGGWGYYYVVSFDGRGAQYLYRSESDSLPERVSGSFRDDFRCFVEIAGTYQNAEIDLSSRKSTFVEAGAYDGTGKLLKPLGLDVDPFSLMRPIDIDGDGIHELQGIVSCSAIFHANKICTVTLTQRYENGSWQLAGEKITP